MARAARTACAALLLIGATQLGNAGLSAYAFASGTFAATLTSAVGPLHTSGARLMNAQNQEVRITGVNWFGLETDSFAPHGLWARNYGDMLDQIAAAGFNTVRLPFSNELLNLNSLPKGVDYQKNPDLQGLSGLQVMDRIIDAAGQRGLAVLLDRHRPTSSGQTELWYSNDVPASQWIQDWVTLAQRYAGNPTVIGADLHNEPHGPATWGDGNPATDWRLAAEDAGDAILAVNADWLILVEGVERYGNDWYWWGGNLAGARDAPVRLSVDDRLVYSTHDYGPGVYHQKWFDAPAFPANLPGIWNAHWAYLQQGDVAPVLVGEFGGRSVGSDEEGIWQRSLVDFIARNGLSYTYWAWNPDSGDTGGILSDDWQTLNQSKLAMLAGSPVVASSQAEASPVAVAAQQGDQTPTPVAVAQQPLDQTPTPTAVAAQQSQVTDYAPGGPFDPDLQHALGGVGGPNDPDPVHRQARERDERLYLQDFETPWPYAAYVTSP